MTDTPETLKRRRREAFERAFVKSHLSPDTVNGPAEYNEWVEIDKEEATSFNDETIDLVWKTAMDYIRAHVEYAIPAPDGGYWAISPSVVLDSSALRTPNSTDV